MKFQSSPRAAFVSTAFALRRPPSMPKVCSPVIKGGFGGQALPHRPCQHLRPVAHSTSYNDISGACGMRMLIDPWSVSPEALDVLAGQFFAVSLIPYLIFLYFLSRDETDCPPLANFGFQFLLAFVFATIPAGIYAKLHYHDILANIDWLHGSAESLLTLTNLLITLGFRRALRSESSSSNGGETKLRAAGMPVVMGVLTVLGLLNSTGIHMEPSNALSLPTWVIHISSLVEWLIAMRLIWSYADHSGNSKWRGLVWGMIPLHASGLCACTFHLFYNAPALNALVAIQAGLTAFGNATMAIATVRIAQGGKDKCDMKDNIGLKNMEMKVEKNWDTTETGSEDGKQGEKKKKEVVRVEESDGWFVGKLMVVSTVVSMVVKWGSLAVDFPFQHEAGVAVGMIVVPTMVNMGLWAVRSKGEGEDFGPSWL